MKRLRYRVRLSLAGALYTGAELLGSAAEAVDGLGYRLCDVADLVAPGALSANDQVMFGVNGNGEPVKASEAALRRLEGE